MTCEPSCSVSQVVRGRSLEHRILTAAKKELLATPPSYCEASNSLCAHHWCLAARYDSRMHSIPVSSSRKSLSPRIGPQGPEPTLGQPTPSFNIFSVDLIRKLSLHHSTCIVGMARTCSSCPCSSRHKGTLQTRGSSPESLGDDRPHCPEFTLEKIPDRSRPDRPGYHTTHAVSCD